MVSRLAHVIRAELTSDLESLGLTVRQYTVLSELLRREPLSNAELARSSYVSPQAMNQVIAVLEERRLVRRRPSANHRWIQPAELTAKGRRLAESAESAAHDIADRAMRGVDDSDRERFMAMLRHGIEALGYPVGPTALPRGRADKDI